MVWGPGILENGTSLRIYDQYKSLQEQGKSPQEIKEALSDDLFDEGKPEEYNYLEWLGYAQAQLESKVVPKQTAKMVKKIMKEESDIYLFDDDEYEEEERRKVMREFYNQVRQAAGIEEKFREGQAELDALFLKEVKSRGCNEALKHLAAGANPNALNQAKLNALWLAALNSDHYTLERLIEAGCSVNQNDIGFMHVMYYANQEYVDADILRILIEGNLDVNASVDEDDNKPLHICATHGGAVKLLLEKGADADALNAMGQTALMLAAAENKARPARHLLKHGADMNLQNRAGKSAFDIAREGGEMWVLYLFQELQENAGELSQEAELLLDAVRTNDAHRLRRLLQRGYDVESKNLKGNTLMFLAAGRNRLEAVRVLHEFGADVNVTDQDGNSALQAAMRCGGTDAAKYLVEHGADVNHLGFVKMTPLLTSVATGDLELVKMLVEHGAYLDAQVESTGNTAICQAAVGGRIEIMKYLYEAGAKFAHKGEYSALVDAANFGRLDCLKLIIEWGGDVNEWGSGDLALSKAAWSGHMDVVKFLLENGAKVNKPSRWNHTAIGEAAGKNRIEIVKYLLEHGASVETHPEYHCCMALRDATIFGYLDVVKLLIEAGADYNVINKWGSTTLDHAQKEGHKEIIEYLQSIGAVTAAEA